MQDLLIHIAVLSAFFAIQCSQKYLIVSGYKRITFKIIYTYTIYMDKHIEETRSIYYESSQDSHSSDSDWSYPEDS